MKAIQATEIATLDVLSTSSTATMYVTRPVYSTLLKVDPTNPSQIIGDLATEWKISNDGTAYTFTLRDNVRWHDGKPLTADDVAFSIERMGNPPKGTVSVRKTLWGPVSKAEAIAPNIVRITVRVPAANLLVLLAASTSQIWPKHILENDPGALRNRSVGSGPFVFVRNEKGVIFEAKRNENYYVKGRPYLDGLQYYVISDKATAFAAIRAHRVNFGGWGTGSLSVSQAEQIKREGLKINLVRYPSIGGQMIFLNQRSGHSFADERVRKAFALATDVPGAIQIALEGLGRVRGAFVNPAFALPESELRQYPQFQPVTEKTLAEAKTLLASAGYPTGLDVDGLTLTQSNYVNAMEIFAQQAKSVFRIRIRSYETGAAYDMLKAGNFDMSVAPGSPATNDPSVRASEYYVSTAGTNYAGINDKKVDEYYQMSLKEVDPVKRRQLVQEWERYMLDHYLTWYFANNEYIMPMWQEIRDKYIPDLEAEHHWQDVWIAQ